MKLDAVSGEVSHLTEHVVGTLAAEEITAHFGISRVNRDVLGRQPLLNYAIKFHLGDGRHSRVVTVKKRQTSIFVFEEQRLARAFRILVAETEDAVVRTLARRE